MADKNDDPWGIIEKLENSLREELPLGDIEALKVAKKVERETIKEGQTKLKALKASLEGKSEKMDTRIRGLDRLTWELFKQHCREESVRRNKPISANIRMIEMIEVIVAQNNKDL